MRRYDTRLFRVFTGHVWRKRVKFFFRALKIFFKKKIPPRFLDYHRVSVENL